MYPIYTAQNVHFGWNEKVIGFVQSLKYYDSIVKKEAEKYREKTEAASRETKVVLEEKSIQTAEGLQKSKHRLLGIAMLGKKVPKSVVEKILEYNLSAEQLEEIRQCVESGLADAEILQVMENSPSPERMKKMREIILLMRKRKAGV